MFILFFLENVKVNLVSQKNVVAAVLGANSRREQLIAVACRYVHYLKAQKEGHRYVRAVCYSTEELLAVVVICTTGGYVGTPSDKVCHHLQ